MPVYYYYYYYLMNNVTTDIIKEFVAEVKDVWFLIVDHSNVKISWRPSNAQTKEDDLDCRNQELEGYYTVMRTHID